jgi:circadian clock protein KaiB
MMGAVRKSGDKASERAAPPKREKKTRAARKKWSLRLYVAGRSPKSQKAFVNLRNLCEKHIPGQYSIEIVDLLTDPALAKVDQILAIPTLVRRVPSPLKRIIGDLSDSERAMVALELAPVER